MRIELVSQVYLRAERIEVEVVWRKKLTLALRAASHGRNIIRLLQDDECSFYHDLGCPRRMFLVDYLPLDFCHLGLTFFDQHF